MNPPEEATKAIADVAIWQAGDAIGGDRVHEFAEAALHAALPSICEDIAKQIDLTPSQCQDGDYSEGYLDAMVACTQLVRRYPATEQVSR